MVDIQHLFQQISTHVLHLHFLIELGAQLQLFDMAELVWSLCESCDKDFEYYCNPLENMSQQEVFMKVMLFVFICDCMKPLKSVNSSTSCRFLKIKLVKILTVVTVETCRKLKDATTSFALATFSQRQPSANHI